MNRPALDASPDALRRAAPLWESLADDLGAVGRRLAGAGDGAAALGQRVQPALTRFLDRWESGARRRSGQARRHGEQLLEMSRTYTTLDHETATELRSLLPWEGTRPFLAPVPWVQGPFGPVT